MDSYFQITSIKGFNLFEKNMYYKQTEADRKLFMC